MTLNDALILSYIKRGIGYGYNILSHVKESGSDEWVDFSRAGLYKTLDKLEKKGLVKKKLVRDKDRPAKKIYSITDSGDSELNIFIEEGFDFDYVDKNKFDSYLVTAVAASPSAKSLGETIGKRIDAVQKQLDILSDEWPKDKDSYPFIVYSLYKRRIGFLEAEQKWLKWLFKILENTSGDVLNMTFGEAK
ncbi:helix-turn-helix transcriptional regulator [Candidatus Latescibacterota bacterium]